MYWLLSLSIYLFFFLCMNFARIWEGSFFPSPMGCTPRETGGMENSLMPFVSQTMIMTRILYWEPFEDLA